MDMEDVICSNEIKRKPSSSRKGKESIVAAVWPSLTDCTNDLDLNWTEVFATFDNAEAHTLEVKTTQAEVVTSRPLKRAWPFVGSPPNKIRKLENDTCTWGIGSTNDSSSGNKVACWLTTPEMNTPSFEKQLPYGAEVDSLARHQTDETSIPSDPISWDILDVEMDIDEEYNLDFE